MAILIESTEDFLRLLRENKEFLAAARSEILTQELMRLPVEAGKRFGGLEEDVQGIRNDMQGMERRLTGQIDGVGDKVSVELKAQSSFRGTYAQATANSERVEISDLFAYLHGVKRTDAMPVGRSTLRSWLKGKYTEVVEALGLRERAWRTFRNPDIIAAVHDLMADDDASPLYYIAVEASYSIDGEDVAKATDHAKIVHAVTGLTVYAVVAGVRLDDEIEDDARNKICAEVAQYVETDNRDMVYWHRLESSDLRPLEPR